MTQFIPAARLFDTIQLTNRTAKTDHDMFLDGKLSVGQDACGTIKADLKMQFSPERMFFRGPLSVTTGSDWPQCTIPRAWISQQQFHLIPPPPTQTLTLLAPQVIVSNRAVSAFELVTVQYYLTSLHPPIANGEIVPVAVAGIPFLFTRVTSAVTSSTTGCPVQSAITVLRVPYWCASATESMVNRVAWLLSLALGDLVRIARVEIRDEAGDLVSGRVA
jgi:hypothetical protein